MERKHPLRSYLASALMSQLPESFQQIDELEESHEALTWAASENYQAEEGKGEPLFQISSLAGTGGSFSYAWDAADAVLAVRRHEHFYGNAVIRGRGEFIHDPQADSESEEEE